MLGTATAKKVCMISGSGSGGSKQMAFRQAQTTEGTVRSPRLLSAVLVAALSTGLIAGCGNENNPVPTAVTGVGTTTSVATPVVTAMSTPGGSARTTSAVPTKAGAWTAIEQAYLDRVGQWGDRYTTDFSKLGDLLGNPNPFDGGWTSDLNNALADLDALDTEVLSYAAPARFTELHEN